MFDNIASFDIGASSIKVIKARRGIKNFEITSILIEEVSVDDSHAYYFDAISKCISTILIRENFSDTTIIISIPADSIFLRNISFPFADMDKIRNAIPYEAEESIPFPTEKLAMDFQPVIQNNVEGRNIILAAMDRELLLKIVELFNNVGLYPVFAGLESNAILKCYDYFNSVNDETVLLIDIGYSKTVLNIIQNNSLMFTRSIPSGTGNIISLISELLDVKYNDAMSIFERLDIDLSSFEANINKDKKVQPVITRQKLKKIYSNAVDTISGIINDITITIKASDFVTDYSGFNRIMLSGGGSNIKGVSKLLGDESGLPVVFMPFMPDYTDQNIRSRFSVCLGNLLVYMNNRNVCINLLRNETDFTNQGSTHKKYHLSILFLSLTVVVLIINFGLTLYSVFKSDSYSNDVLRQKYKRYFNTQNVPQDPVKEASKLIQKDRQELKALHDMLGEQASFIELLNEITKEYSNIPGFYIKKLTFDGNGMLLDGEVKNSTDLEEYKRNLMQGDRFESVSINIMDTNRDRSVFRMIIKPKNTPGIN